jgi:hypothetical protein
MSLPREDRNLTRGRFAVLTYRKTCFRWFRGRKPLDPSLGMPIALRTIVDWMVVEVSKRLATGDLLLR